MNFVCIIKKKNYITRQMQSIGGASLPEGIILPMKCAACMKQSKCMSSMLLKPMQYCAVFSMCVQYLHEAEINTSRHCLFGIDSACRPAIFDQYCIKMHEL